MSSTCIKASEKDAQECKVCVLVWVPNCIVCRAGKVEAAVSLARTDLAPLRGRFLGRSEEFDAMLHDVVALLAYTEPEVQVLTKFAPSTQ